MRLKTKKRYLGKLPSQKEFLTWKLLAQGLTSKDIAKKRRVSVGTIETVRSVLLSKLGARNGPTLIAMWYTRGKKSKRKRAIEAGAFGSVDNTHSTATDLLEDLVVRDGRPDHDDFLSVGRQQLQRKQHRQRREFLPYKATSVQAERQMADFFSEILRENLGYD